MRNARLPEAAAPSAETIWLVLLKKELLAPVQIALEGVFIKISNAVLWPE